jgi:hypothetical protein
VGLLAGGAQCTGEVTRTPYSSSPSSAVTAVGCEASPMSYSAWYSTSPERSPVNIRPVRFPPCAAGASPTISIRASAGPKPGTGRPQYVQSANAARLVRATSSRQSTSRGQARQPEIRRSRSAKAFTGPRYGQVAEVVVVGGSGSHRPEKLPGMHGPGY